MPTRRRFLAASLPLTLGAPGLASAAWLAEPAQRPSRAASASEASPPPAVAALTSRIGEAVPITAAERQARADKARKLMQQAGIAAIVITGGTSLLYFTNIRSGQSERLFAWILPATGSPYIVCPSFEEGRMTEQLASIPDGHATRIYTWHEDEDPYNLLARHLPSTSGPDRGTIAIDERVQFVFADRIRQADPWRRIVSAIPVIAGCRQLKSPAELALMQLANDITLAVYKAAWQSAGPGTTNRQFSALVAQGYARCGVQGAASCQVGPYSALPHGSLSPQVIGEGQIVLIDDGCTVEGYQSDISRTFRYGRPKDSSVAARQEQVFSVVHEAQAAALAAARPGVPCHAIDDAARQVVTRAGFGPDYRTFSHRLGHGIGMDGHEWPYLVRGNNTLLQPGMCFSDEPGIYLAAPTPAPGSPVPEDPAYFGVRLEDDWHVTETAGRMFTPTSPSLDQPFA